ncbi:MAG: peptidase S10, partial [Gammaproteobacteria bacterium]|nr:peptidase S10 [Gammaproteobacteria bacterium]
MRIRLIYSLSILFVSTVIFAGNDISSLPGASTILGKEEAGYLPSSKKTKLFYWFVASHQPSAPLVIWANGGPGYSSFYGFFKEDGPYFVTKNLQLKPRKNGWNNFANYLVIEESGVGFSAEKNALLPKNRDQAVTQYYNALISFLEAHPQYANSPVYLAGESYAGTMLPLVAKKIFQAHSA